MLTYDLNKADEYSVLKIGDSIPDFHWKDETGQELLSGKLLGKYTLIVFFAADCRHCRDNFEYLEKNLFKTGSSNLNIMAFGRECNVYQLESYQKKYSLSIMLYADPEKEIYSKFAEKAIPRIYLFDTNGKLLKSIRGFRIDEINEMIGILIQ
jgi:peroxiredoxin